MINEKLIYYFANVIGYLKIAINLESLQDIRTKYEMVLDQLLKWTKYYYENKNLDIVTHDNSLKNNDILEDVKNNIVFRSDIGIESELTDNILINYEVIGKTIMNNNFSNQAQHYINIIKLFLRRFVINTFSYVIINYHIEKKKAKICF